MQRQSGIDSRPTLSKDDILKTQRKDQNFRMKKRKREERAEAIKHTEKQSMIEFHQV